MREGMAFSSGLAQGKWDVGHWLESVSVGPTR
nr:MAG TPA: hypothetical protein [Caudoviricetes sp.]